MECMKLHSLKFYHMSNHFGLSTFNLGFNYMMSFDDPFFWDVILGFTHPNYYKEISLGFKFWCHKVSEKINVVMLI
jgi:hypothetical protein